MYSLFFQLLRKLQKKKFAPLNSILISNPVIEDLCEKQTSAFQSGHLYPTLILSVEGKSEISAKQFLRTSFSCLIFIFIVRKSLPTETRSKCFSAKFISTYKRLLFSLSEHLCNPVGCRKDGRKRHSHSLQPRLGHHYHVRNLLS